MFASIRQYTVNPEHMDRLIASLPTVVEAISALPGFRSYSVVRGSGGAFASVSIFETEDQAAASNQVAAQWVSEHVADLFAGPPSLVSGSVPFYRSA